MIRCFVAVITCFVICMIFCGLIRWVDTYDEFEGVFAVSMVEMDKRRYLGKIQERQDQQDGTQFCSLEVVLHGYSNFNGRSLSPLMPWRKLFQSRQSIQGAIIRSCDTFFTSSTHTPKPPPIFQPVGLSRQSGQVMVTVAS